MTEKLLQRIKNIARNDFSIGVIGNFHSVNILDKCPLNIGIMDAVDQNYSGPYFK